MGTMHEDSGPPRSTSGDVFLIHGRNLAAKAELERFLVSLRLRPVDFADVRRSLPPANPTILDLVTHGLKTSQLTIALFTADEWSVLRGDFRHAGEDETEQRRWQARPNVIFEGGLAYGIDPERVVFVLLGNVELFSDFREKHCFRPTNASEIGSARHTLKEWLRKRFEREHFVLADNDQWKTEGDFESSVTPRAKPPDPLDAPSAGWPWLERQALRRILNSAHRSRTILGDSIDLMPWRRTRFRVAVDPAHLADTADFSGRLTLSEHGALVNRWLDGYDDRVKAFVRSKIADMSKGAAEFAKLGFAYFDAGAAAQNDVGAFSVRPVNHLVTTAFNRGLALERMNDRSYGSPIHELWAERVKKALSALQTVHLDCPSQIFVELALVTKDGYVPLTQKNDLNSVYALRNRRAMVWTCGIESGANWRKVVSSTESSSEVEVDLVKASVAALKSEFGLEVAEEVAAGPNLAVKTFVMQMLHLNTAFIGYWVLPFTRLELNERCKGLQLGGMDHSNLHFRRVEDVDKELKYEESTQWHGTAMRRMAMLSTHIEELRPFLDRPLRIA